MKVDSFVKRCEMMISRKWWNREKKKKERKKIRMKEENRKKSDVWDMSPVYERNVSLFMKSIIICWQTRFHGLNLFLVSGNWSTCIDSAYIWSQLLKVYLWGPFPELTQAAYGYCNFWVPFCSSPWFCFLDVSECQVCCIVFDSFVL